MHLNYTLNIWKNLIKKSKILHLTLTQSSPPQKKKNILKI